MPTNALDDQTLHAIARLTLAMIVMHVDTLDIDPRDKVRLLFALQATINDLLTQATDNSNN